MDHIRQTLKLERLSSLKRSELASKLAEFIPIKFKDIMYSFDKNTYDLIKSIANAGAIPANIEFSKIKILMRYGIIFPGLVKGQKILYMPVELIKEFNLLDVSETEKVISRNTEWIQLTQGMLYYYGYMDSWRLIKNVQKYVEQNIDITEFIKVISFACNYYENIDMWANGYKDARVFDCEKIIIEHNKRPEFDYYPFTKKQLLKVGSLNNKELLPEMETFINFLLLNYDLPEDVISEISTQLTSLVNNESTPEFIIKYLETWLEIPSPQYNQVLTAKITELYNNTHQWVLKGHAPNGLYPKAEEQQKTHPIQEKSVNITKAKIIEMPKPNKIGRNDLCPCGSGKKYKKCCGK